MIINSIIMNVEYTFRQFMGEDYMVVPVSMLVEGVHNGSGGSLFYPSLEIQKTVENWDGVPVTVQHPIDEGGNYIGAKGASEFIIGHLSSPAWDDKLKAKAWINISKANQIAPDIIPFIRSNGQMEVSTGLMSDNDLGQGIWGGENYDAIVKNIIPDHLALLPGGEGACNWEDGCGLRANQKGGEKMLYKGIDKEEIEKLANIKGISINAVKLFLSESSHGDTLRKIQGQINELDSQNQYHYVNDVFDKYFIYGKEGDGERKLYKQAYNLAADESVEFVGDVIEVVEKKEYVSINNNINNNEGGSIMSNEKKDVCCPEKVDKLIANESNGFIEMDREWLGIMKEPQIDKLLSYDEIMDAIKEEKNDLELKVNSLIDEKKKEEKEKERQTLDEYIVNAPSEIQDVLRSGLDMHREKKSSLIAQILANEKNQFLEETLKGKGVSELSNIVALMPREKGEIRDYTGNSVNHNQEIIEEPLIMPELKFD